MSAGFACWYHDNNVASVNDGANALNIGFRMAQGSLAITHYAWSTEDGVHFGKRMNSKQLKTNEKAQKRKKTKTFK